MPDPIAGSSVTCPQCGYDLSGTAIGGTCPECGVSVAASIGAAPAANAATGNDSSPVVCLVLGILSLVSGCLPLGFLAIAWHGMAQRAIAQGRAPRDQAGLATAGLIMGWIAAAIVLLFVGLFVLSFILPVLLMLIAGVIAALSP
ncbi:MAG: hypothetical protein AAGB29_00245 [Planctomycetota bacterium]